MTSVACLSNQPLQQAHQLVAAKQSRPAMEPFIVVPGIPLFL